MAAARALMAKRHRPVPAVRLRHSALGGFIGCARSGVRVSLGIVALLMALTSMVMTSHPAFADSVRPFDQRECVCTFLRNGPADFMTTRVVETPSGYRHEVVEVLAHGVPPRQQAGELVVDFRRSSGSDGISGAFLVRQAAAPDEFVVIEIPSFDLDAVHIRTLSVLQARDTLMGPNCKTEFSLSQLKRFAEAFNAGKGTCSSLATKYLAIPGPYGYEQCSSGRSTGWLLSMLAFLVYLGVRARRRPTA